METNPYPYQKSQWALFQENPHCRFCDKPLQIPGNASDPQTQEFLQWSLKLQDLLDTYQSLFHEAPVGYLVFNESHQILKINENLRKMIRIPEDRFQEISVFTLFEPEERNQFSDYLQELSQSEKSLEISLHLRGKNGTLPILLRGRKVLKEGETIFLVTLMDFSQELEKREGLEKANSAQRKFFQIMAHDLKNAFINIVGFSDLLMHRCHAQEPDPNFEFVKALNSSAKNTFKLLENFLQWANSQTRNLTYIPEQINLKDVLMGAEQDLKMETTRKQIQIHSEIGDSLMAWADRNMLLSILRNLLSNAVKYSVSGKSVWIRARKENGAVTVSIQDEGVGMAAEEVENLFKLEMKSSKPGTSGERGTGLGLILCRELIERQKGKIQVQSELGQGSIFSFTLPLKAEDL